ncbi:MAG: serine hydrolase [Bacteroidia bacterium]
MRYLSAKTYLLALLFFIGNIAYSQITSQEIDQLVDSAMSTFKVVGAAVAVVKDGKIVHAKGYGLRSIDSKKRVNEHTNFDIASNSKAFTTAALAILVEEGKLAWTDKVKDHIPEFTMYNAYVTENFNIQDLLTHRSGLGLGAGDLMFWPAGTDFAMKDVLRIFKHFKPQSAFRTKFDYDNVLYLVAGEVIARVSGMSWERFIETRIMEPLNMDQSFSNYAYAKDSKNIATPHLEKDGIFRTLEHDLFDPKKLNGAAASIISNVDDIAQWMLVQLNEGRYGDSLKQQLFSEESQREMWKIHNSFDVYPDPRYRTHFAGYGLGWGLKDVNGYMQVSHTGGLSGMLSKTILIPDLDMGVVVLTNTWMGGAGLFSAVSQRIVDRYIGLEDYDWIAEYAHEDEVGSNFSDSVVTQVWATVDTADASHIRMVDYVGTYEDVWLGKVDISLKNGQLWFQSQRSPLLGGPMAFYKGQAFAIRWETPNMECDAFAIFSLDEEGKAQGISMKGIAPDIDFSFDFQDLDLRRVD